MSERELIRLGHTLGTLVAFGIIARNRQRKLKHELERAHRRTMYLAALLDKQGYELDEFDKIAILEA